MILLLSLSQLSSIFLQLYLTLNTFAVLFLLKTFNVEDVTLHYWELIHNKKYYEGAECLALADCLTVNKWKINQSINKVNNNLVHENVYGFK